MHKDRQISFDAIASELGILHSSVHRILHDDLNMHCVCLHIVHKMLSLEQKEVKMDICRDLTDIANEDGSFLKKIMTNDDMVLFNDLQTKH